MIIEILKGTPWWVYLMLFVLIAMGMNACRTRNIKLTRLFIFPIVFICVCAMKIQNIPVFVICFVIGIIIGWLIFNHSEIKVDKEKRLIQVPGSIIPLILIVFAFAKGYFVGYESAVNPQLLKMAMVNWIIIITSGAFSGIMFGRVALYIFRYIKSESVSLEFTGKSRG